MNFTLGSIVVIISVISFIPLICIVLKISCSCGPQFATSILYLVSQVLNKESIEVLFKGYQHQNQEDLPSSSFQESTQHQKDAGDKMKNRQRIKEKRRKESLPRELNLEENKKLQEENQEKDFQERKEYQVNARDPLFANPDKGWEMQFLTQHFHPSVCLFASSIKESPEDKLEYDGDPLQDFSLKHFIDRFVHRTPKKLDKKDVLVAKQASLFGRQSRIKRRTSNRAAYESLSQKEVIHLNEDNIPVEERFIYKFLQSRDFKIPGKKDNGSEDEDEIQSVSSNEFEDILDKFEHDFEADGFEIDKEFQGKKKNKLNFKRKRDEDNDDDDENVSTDDEDPENGEWSEDDPDEDEELDFDEDEEYATQLKELMEDDEISAEESDDESHSKPTNLSSAKDLFASAEQFAHLLKGFDGEVDEGSEHESMAADEEYNNDEEDTGRPKKMSSVKKNRKTNPSSRPRGSKMNGRKNSTKKRHSVKAFKTGMKKRKKL